MRRFLLLFLLLAIVGWVALHRYRQQNSLHRQLEQLTAVLTVENNRVAKEAHNTIKSVEATIAKNRNQPAEIALLRRAEALQASVHKLLDALRDYNGLLRHAASNSAATALLQQLRGAPRQVLGHETLRQQTLRKQVTAYADTLRRLGLAQTNTVPLVAPDFDEETPVIDALADLSQLESEILARQTFALQRIAKSVETQTWLTHLVITATAESNVLAPGDTYRARLELVSYFSAAEVPMRMTCNGRPVAASPYGTGLVSFRAPTRPGPATWTGTIRINQYGRDTTFQITVPYRVARR